jgi:putative endonuclease
VRYLKKKGYRILVRNYTAPTGEIDIIAADGGTLVFVEVKARSDDLFGEPAEAVDHRKRRRIMNTALHYLAGLKREYLGRFDIVSVHLRGRKAEIEHLPDAFGAADTF